MSVKSLEEKATEKFDPYSDAGQSLYNQKSAEDLEGQKLESLYNSPAITAKERERKHPEQAQRRKKNQRFLRNLFTSKSLKKRGALLPLMLVLFGGGGFLTVFFSPSLAIVQMKEVFTESLNDQLRAVDERSAFLIRSKLKDVTRGSCGAIKIKCNFATITDKQAAKFRAAGIEVSTTPKEERRLFTSNRGQILSMKFPSGEVFDGNNVKDLQKHLVNNVDDRKAMLKAYNPSFTSLTDKTALGVMRLFKISKNVVITGETDEERRERLNSNVSGVENADAGRITIKTDENGKELYFDEEGNELTKEQVDAAEEQSKRWDEYGRSGGTKSVLSAAVKGASIVGYMDSACTVYNSLRFVSALAKAKKQAQAARYAMAMVLTPADSIKAGSAQEGTINFAGNTLTEIYPGEQVLDESTLSQPGTASQPKTILDPEAGKNAFDSPGYRIAAHNDAPDLSLRASKFMVGGGAVAIFDNVLAEIARIVNLGDPNPQQVSEKCGYIQNPAVRFTGLAIGIIAGVGTFGLTTAASVGGSMAIALALPFIESQGADILAGNIFKDISGIDSGDAAYVGAVGLFGTIAMKRGMKPMNRDEGLKVLAANKESYQRYAETERQLARAAPFDVMNRFSFMGSIAYTLVPTFERSKSSASMAMMNIASLVPNSFASLFPSAKAASVNQEYFDKCNDPGYKSIGIAAGPFCEVRYGLSEEELAIDPLDNVQWMVDNGQIDPDTGEAMAGIGPVSGDTWSYAKFLEQCVNRTVGWGEDQNENEGNGSNCVSHANEEKNKHFRIYTMDKTVEESLSGEPVQALAPGTSGYRTGQTGIVGADGWGLPVLEEFEITSGFQSAARPNHKGIDIAGDSAAETLGKPIFAARDGRVTAAGPADGFGNWIVIEHEVAGKKISTVYGHMYDDGVLVKVGDTVKAGQEIGKVGNNGQSTGPHLHFELWDGSPLSGGTAINPTPLIDAVKKSPTARRIDV